MSNLKNLVPCCIKVFKQKPDSEGYYIEPTKNQMIDKLLEQHDKLTKYKRAFEILKKYIAELTESGIFSYNINEPLEIRMCVGWCLSSKSLISASDVKATQ